MDKIAEKLNKYNVSILLVILFVFLLTIFNLSNSLGWGGDDAQIVSQAISILSKSLSNHFIQYDFIISNSIDPIGTRAYSWGLPLILALLYKVYMLVSQSYTLNPENLNYVYLKLSMIMSFIGIIILLYKELVKRVSFSIAVIFTSLFAFSPYLINFTNELMKDLPFTFLSFFTVILLNKFVFEQNFRFKIWLAINVCIMNFLCLITRENGIIVLLMLLLCWFYNVFFDIKNKTGNLKLNNLIYFVILFLVTAAFYFFSKFFPVEYVKNIFSYNFETISYNFLYYIKEFKLCFFDLNVFKTFFISLFFILFIVGLVNNLKKEFIYFIFLLFICTNFVFSANQGIRYVLPFVPLIFLFSALGVQYFKNGKVKAILLIAFMIPIFINIANICSTINLNFNNKSEFGITSVTAKDMYKYIRENTNNSDIIVYCKPRTLHLYTGRLSFQISSNRELLKNADYQLSIVGDDSPGTFYNKENYDFSQKTYIEEANVFLIPIYRNDNYVFYKIVK